MADWQDGAEYAPVERPDGFAMPVADPLEAVEPERAPTPGPMLAPSDYAGAPGIPLHAIATAGAPPRDPQTPFSVVGSVMTGDSAWGAAHNSPYVPTAFDPSRPIFTSATSAAEFGPPTTTPFAGASYPPPGEQAFPPQPGQFSPAPLHLGQQAPQQRSPAAVRQLVLVCAGLCMLGWLFPALAVGVLCAAGGLMLFALPARRGLGGGMLTSAAALLSMQWASPAPPNLVTYLVSLAWAVGLTVLALRMHRGDG